MSEVIKPMLAADISDQLSKLRYPCYICPKLDGVRALATDLGLLSRSWKMIPNKKAQARFGERVLAGLDGELIVGSPTAPDVYRHTQSVTSRADSEEAVDFYVFDDWNMPISPYLERVSAILESAAELTTLGIKIVQSYIAENEEQLLKYEADFLEQGYEGCILRSPRGLYKNGRSTVNEQGMLKLKRFTDGEAVIIGVEEEMHNGNIATADAFGRTERSSHKANLSGKGRMGALVVRDTVTGVEFKIGTGFDSEMRRGFWSKRDEAVSKGWLVKYKHFVVGAKDKPRFPTYLGLRARWDL